ncbi:hypothetical protein [Marinomonas phage CPP1m]|uniref:Deoxynucleotide monophosphate kinase n=2 Tax=Murciavirus CPP1m TaxID=2733327 RepID=A0A1W5S0Z3_9CAUD|nr:hypothetical protein HOR72_gp45 [Marinomonas phage CPP1m]ARB11245.1 hypothetical protein [Marinomonas phage CPP1m]ARB11295.1 hypothetical protein [Marinomonas phage CPG1g]
MANVLILNAPAGAGKDTIADILSEEFGYHQDQFKKPMFDMAIAMSGMTETAFMQAYNNRDEKEAKQSHLGGLSYRELMIKISEEFVKPLLGKDSFGSLASARCRNRDYEAIWGGVNIIFSDGGFIEETDKLHKDGHSVTVCRLHRDGYSFEGDSRDYIYPALYESFDIHLEEGNPSKAVNSIRCKLYDKRG